MPSRRFGSAGLVVFALAAEAAACATSVDPSLSFGDVATADASEDRGDRETSVGADDSSNQGQDSGNAKNETGNAGDGSGGAVDSTGTVDGGGNGDADAGSRSDVSIPGPDVGSSVPDSGIDSSPGADTGITETGGGGRDAAACLQNIPASCPNCLTQNASDKPKCEDYLSCYSTNGCNPSLSCGSNPDGVCGVNKIGGGYAPQSAAVQTYNCACP